MKDERPEKETRKIETCQMCFDLEWEEAILCPQCYGSGKILKSEDSENLNFTEIRSSI